jgi:hypothetical protein
MAQDSFLRSCACQELKERHRHSIARRALQQQCLLL